MCDFKAYLLEKDRETLIMESVDRVESENEGYTLTDIFGEQKFLKAQFRFMGENRILFETQKG
jgi:predicted RNA-binding protein